MEVIRFSLDSMPKRIPHLALCLGTFDGVHLGHQRLFLEARIYGEGPSGALLFSATPNEVLHLGKDERVLTSLDDKIRLCERYGLDYCYIVEATEEFFGLSPEEFIKKTLLPLGCETAVCGTDFTFGNKALGNPLLLKQFLKVIEVPLIYKEKEKVASRCIKEIIEEGEVEEASAHLGRDYEINGVVEPGLQNGRTIGFPTMNLHLSANYVLPKTGVYYGLCYVRGIPYKAMINVGVNPTVGKRNAPIVEAHLLHFKEGECYGEKVFLTFKKWRRDETKFTSLEQLKNQLESDRDWVEDQD